MVPFEEGELIASVIPGARLAAFESKNHVPMCGELAFVQMNCLIDEFVLGDSQGSRSSAAHTRAILKQHP
jgi:hypothetical protein